MVRGAEKGESTYDWEYSYSLLKNFYDKYGVCDVPMNYAEKKGERTRVIYWCILREYKENNLKQEFIDKLNEINFEWNPRKHGDWDHLYELLLSFKQEFESVDVPTGFVYKGRKLGNWLTGQRFLYGRNQLSDDKLEKLIDIGVICK